MRMHAKSVSEKEYSLAKTLLEASLSAGRIAKVMDRSYATIVRISTIPTWGEYVAKREAYAKLQRERKGSEKPAQIAEFNKEKVLEELSKIRESLFNLETWLNN
jgi:hypothetical protein